MNVINSMPWPTPLRVLDLFSGIGGFSLGLSRAGMRTAAFCEIEKFPRCILRKRWPNVPIYDDVRQLNATRLADDGIGRIDLICGGFPCQSWSVAGKQAGAGDERHLWPEMYRLVRELHPRWIIVENVPGLDDDAGLGLAGVLFNLDDAGYESVPFEIPACAVNAPHLRNRLWIVAHRSEQRLEGGKSERQRIKFRVEPPDDSNQSHLAHADRSRQPQLQERDVRQERGQPMARRMVDAERSCEGNLEHSQSQRRREGWTESEIWSGGSTAGEPGVSRGDVAHTSQHEGGKRNGELHTGNGGSAARGELSQFWDTAEWLECHDGKTRRIKPGIQLLAHGLSGRVARLKAIGNAVVPQVVERIGRAIMSAAPDKERS